LGPAEATDHRLERRRGLRGGDMNGARRATELCLDRGDVQVEELGDAQLVERTDDLVGRVARDRRPGDRRPAEGRTSADIGLVQALDLELEVPDQSRVVQARE